MMGERRFLRLARHPAFALVCAVLFALVALALIREGVAARNRLAAADDPVRISDQALDRSLQSGCGGARNRRCIGLGRYRPCAKLCRARGGSRRRHRSGLGGQGEGRRRATIVRHQHRRPICAWTVDRRAHRPGKPRRHRVRRSLCVRRYPRRRARGHALSDRASTTIRGFSVSPASALPSPPPPMPPPASPRRSGSAFRWSRRRAAPAGSIRSWRCAPRARR